MAARESAPAGSAKKRENSIQKKRKIPYLRGPAALVIIDILHPFISGSPRIFIGKRGCNTRKPAYAGSFRLNITHGKP
jgi:hypothetical protein